MYRFGANVYVIEKEDEFLENQMLFIAHTMLFLLEIIKVLNIEKNKEEAFTSSYLNYYFYIEFII